MRPLVIIIVVILVLTAVMILFMTKTEHPGKGILNTDIKEKQISPQAADKNNSTTKTISSDTGSSDAGINPFSVNIPPTAGNPPDKPIAPNDFVAKIGSGAWMVTRGPLSSKKSRILFDKRIPGLLVAAGCPGGRLHMGISDQIDAGKMTVPPETMKYIHEAVDSCLASGMYIVMMVEIIKGKKPSARDLELHYKIWDKICYEMRNKSHRLAIVPFIEWHGWEDEPEQEKRKKFRGLQKKCTEIFRKYNPTRILGYKGMGSSRLNGPPWGFLELDKGIKNPYYILCGSASSLGTAHHSRMWLDWGINKQYTQQQIKDEIYNFFKPAFEFRDKYGSAIFVDHWTAPVEGDEGTSIDVGKRIAELKSSRTNRAKKDLAKLYKMKDKAEYKGQEFVIPKYKLSQSEAFINYVSELIRKNGIGGAFQPRAVDYFWDDDTASPRRPAPGTSEYRAQQTFKKMWGPCGRTWQKGMELFH